MLRKVSLCVFTLFIAYTSAIAEDRVEQVWACTINEGYTVDDLKAVHAKWVKWARSKPGGEGIMGYVSVSGISSDTSAVLLIDSYPDLDTLASDWNAYNNSDEGAALEAEYDKISNCTSNSLWAISSVGDE